MADSKEKRIERLREETTRLPTLAEMEEKAAAGWRLAAVEWQRTVDAEADVGTAETPFGLTTPGGGTQLERHRVEEEALRLMLGLVIDDRNSLAQIAEQLNERGFRTRQGRPWAPEDIFDMLPRLIEVAPKFYARTDWPTARPPALH